MGKEKLGLFVILALVGIFIVSSASAEIIISQPGAIYSLGDELSISISLDSIKAGYLGINLVCNGAAENIYYNVPETTTINLKRKLTPDYIKNSTGSCFIQASYDIDSKNSQSFEISKEVTVSLENSNMSYFAGESFILIGNAIKKNNVALNGFVEASLGENIVSTGLVSNGKFSLNFSIPQTLKAGEYLLNLKAYDKEEEILNSGETINKILIKQKPAKIEIAINKQEINPGENIEIAPFVYDYAGDNFISQVLMKIKDSQENVLFEGYIAANEKFNLSLKTNAAPGNGKIIVQKDNLLSEKEFKINELKKIDSRIENQTLSIENSGNVPYTGIIQIIIGNESVLKEINLQIGENKSFEISAPDGTYDVIIQDDSNIYTHGSFSLTGEAISVREIGDKISNVFAHYPIVWFFIVLVIILFVWIYYQRYKTRKKFHFSPSDFNSKRTSEIIKKRGGVEIINPQQTQQKIDSVFERDIRTAEQMTALHGANQQAGIIAIKLKKPVSGIAKENLKISLEYAYKNKAVSYQSGEFIILIFSPLLTKNVKNEEITIKSAMDIDNYLKEHNRKFRNDNIFYGIGVNSGEIINSLAGNILQFAAINKTISLAKRIADISNQEILLSKEIHEKTMNNIKAEKFASGNLDLFIIKRIVDTEKASKFLNEFLKRN